MIDSVKTYWYMYIVLVVLIVILVCVGIKAAKAAKKRNEMMRKFNDDIRRFQTLVKKYENISLEDAKLADCKELCEGITAVLQSQLDKSDKPDEEFDRSLSWKKEVYALFYFEEDTRNSLSFFFRHNEHPLPEVALNGLKSIGDNKTYSIAASMYSMYDDKNESVSLDKIRVADLDAKFKSEFHPDEFFAEVKNYILNNM